MSATILAIIHEFEVNWVAFKSGFWNFGNGAVRNEKMETMHQMKSCHSTLILSFSLSLSARTAEKSKQFVCNISRILKHLVEL